MLSGRSAGKGGGSCLAPGEVLVACLALHAAFEGHLAHNLLTGSHLVHREYDFDSRVHIKQRIGRNRNVGGRTVRRPFHA